MLIRSVNSTTMIWIYGLKFQISMRADTTMQVAVSKTDLSMCSVASLTRLRST
jgi:hypothetical protein